jgi:hypothetical protein
MMLLEDQHRPQADCVLSATTDVDTNALALDKELVTLGSIPSNKSTLALATQVLQVLGVLLREALKARVEVITSRGCVLNQRQTLNFLDDTTEDESARGVTHPGVELAVGLVGTQGRVAEVVTGSLSLLREGNHIGRSLKVPVVVGPEFTGGTNAGLDLVDDEEDIVALSDFTETAEEGGGSMVITTLRLNGLHYDSSDGVVPFLDQALGFLQAALLLLSVLLSVLLERILQRREGSLGPVKGGDIELVNGLTASRGKTAEETTVEASLKRHDRQLRRSGGLVQHTRLKLFLGEFLLGAATLLLTVVHESGLISGLVGVGTRHSGKYLVQALGSDLQNASLQDVSPVSGREITKSWPVDQGGSHLRRSGHLEKVRVVVTNGNRRDLGIAAVGLELPFHLQVKINMIDHVHIEEHVPIEIGDAGSLLALANAARGRLTAN